MESKALAPLSYMQLMLYSKIFLVMPFESKFKKKGQKKQKKKMKKGRISEKPSEYLLGGEKILN